MNDFDDGIEIHDAACPNCGAEHTYRRRCSRLGCEDGWVDMHEYDDPLLFDEGEEEVCSDCMGHGCHIWCRKCGYDLLAKVKAAND